ncbi:ARF GAP-like zinc finger-containing protein [Tritrichomonas foetus]|uniref:ARF GAP-like zinc finger-containing protein n=1 Tax=Tritrichomonas foetus TaxID=1144522 RepID=A0A1J4JLC9_9EUKA|nr:ARF GAP-like zinc finger-containing protein [Tritrichomonas foetus]|eukprot:OHS98357.1 ARF GAP-like zinc finger-containing protein [Tritrichomonas foetus]
MNINSGDPSALNEEALQYMHSTPFFNMEQQRRFEYLKQVGTEITNIAKQFTIYADLGQKMCTEFKSLRKSFNNMEIICTDSSIKPLSDILKAVDTAFTSHFNIIAQKIVSPLNSFVAKELEQLTNEERDYQKHFISFNSAEEKYVSLKPQAKEKDKQEKEQQLVQEHSLATLSFFNFCMRMEGIELKLRSHLPHMFLSYITSVSGPFTECISAMNDKGEELYSTQETIDEVNGQINEFSNHFISLKQQLASQIPVFWERIKTPFTGTNATSIQGFLWKRKTGGFTKSFHRRFFMLSNGTLSYAKNVDDALRTAKNIPLLYCSVKPEPNAPRMNCFSITTFHNNKQSYFLQAVTSWDMNNWLNVIQNNIAAKLNTNDASASEISEGLPPAFQQHVSTICADCGTTNASWASLNFGLTLCDNCVGEHRHVGSGISKVRSLVLDSLDPYQKALIEAIGTEKANEILEKNLPKEEKITPNANNQARRNFIINKYQQKLYIDSAGASQINIEEAIKSQNLMDVYHYLICGGSMDIHENGFTLAHMAACIGNPLILTLILLNDHSLMDKLDDGGWSPLSYATYYNQTLIINVLLGFGANPNKSVNGNLFLIAKHQQNLNLMNRFLNLDPKTANHQRSPSQTSEQSNDEENSTSFSNSSSSTSSTSFSSSSSSSAKNKRKNKNKIKPPHADFHPEAFVFKNFVNDPTDYVGVKIIENKKMNPAEKKKLNTAIDTLRHRLSMTTQHNKNSLESDDDKST